MSSGIWQCFLGALQASVSVLLTMSYGVIASRFRLLRESSSRDINKLCVRVFLPALLITNVGNKLSSDSVGGVIPVLVMYSSYDTMSNEQGLNTYSLGYCLYDFLHGSGILVAKSVEGEVDNHTEDSDNERTEPRNWMGRTAEEEEDLKTATTTLLPDRIAHHSHYLVHGISQRV
jgi:hypothetical protein